ncbi:hypothetical protein [Myxococcus qinghaiensis]|nr:hypothetical protein [Myxococcus qinghaiensis]MCP3163586.1 hypothetical protein [Myxococcus qinghaiensis]
MSVGRRLDDCGRALAESLGWCLLDADDLHPRSNMAKMAARVTLTE